ncbi:MAG: energy transducer TonB [Bacteroidia bacterium]
MKLLLSILLLFSFSCFAQEGDKRGTIKIEKADCVKVKDNDSLYLFVDIMPEFPGGIDSLNKWMNNNLRYPPSGDDASGTVFASFVIGINGRVSDITIFKGLVPSFDNEALRLIGSMPDWIPGKCNGTIVPVKYNFPVRFILR